VGEHTLLRGHTTGEEREMSRIKLLAVGLAMVLVGAWVAADEDVVARISGALAKVTGGKTPDSVGPSPIPGLYEVLYGTSLFYVSADGRYVLDGSMLDMVEQKNLSEPKIAKARLRAVNEVGEDNMIIFGPAETKHTVTVFTDVDCGYCRKFHAGMDEMNQLGIRVRYMMYPRAGLGSDSYKKAVSVWCAKDRNGALTAAKAGREIERKTCKNPVSDHMAVVEELGVRGTPAIVTESGALLPGYVEPKRLFTYLEADGQ
jgi:thiol:disulfide interchange protein DsbC